MAIFCLVWEVCVFCVTQYRMEDIGGWRCLLQFTKNMLLCIIFTVYFRIIFYFLWHTQYVVYQYLKTKKVVGEVWHGNFDNISKADKQVLHCIMFKAPKNRFLSMAIIRLVVCLRGASVLGAFRRIIMTHERMTWIIIANDQCHFTAVGYFWGVRSTTGILDPAAK